MAFTPAQVITEVRRAVQDESTPYRYSDAHMLGVFNQAIRRICILRPDLFAYTSTMTCVGGTLQTAPADSVRIMDVIQNGIGHNVNEVNRESVDLMFTTWQTDATDTCTNWMRHVRNPNLFFVYPPSAAGQVLTIEYVRCPATYAIDDSVTEPQDVYFPCIVDCCVFLLESVDNEHVSSGRAKQFQEMFMQLLGMSVQTKVITDTEESGMPKEEVI